MEEKTAKHSINCSVDELQKLVEMLLLFRQHTSIVPHMTELLSNVSG